ncbi:MAG: globin [Actinomycetota bacterium]
MSEQQVTLYDAVGGEPYFAGLVERFYAAVADDDLLRPMYPRDLAGAEDRLRLFLMQYWGGPTTYSDERGHPRLRMRHNPYRVDVAARDAWLRAMIEAVEADPPAEPMRSAMLEYFVRSADFMRNTPESDEPGSETP